MDVLSLAVRFRCLPAGCAVVQVKVLEFRPVGEFSWSAYAEVRLMALNLLIRLVKASL